MLPFLALVLFTFQSSNAVSLYFTNNSNVAANDIHDRIVRIDSTITSYPTNIPSADFIVSGAIICDNTYYAVWVAALSGPGIFAFDLLTNSMIQYGETKNNFHVFMCTKDKNVLYGVSNDFASPPQFYLDRINITGSTIETETIGTFPSKSDIADGEDTIFSFYGNELWASFADNSDDPKSGILQIMNVQTGTIKNTLSYPREYGQPYFTIPQTMNGNTFKGASLSNGNKVSFVTLTISDNNELSVSDAKDASYLFSSSAPQPICNETGYAIQTKTKSIVAYNIYTGEELKHFDLEGMVDTIGALACV